MIMSYKNNNISVEIHVTIHEKASAELSVECRLLLARATSSI